MDLSPQQQAAIESAESWFNDRKDQVFRVFGYAGTGKTTIATEFSKMVDGRVLFACFTGKAAHVLREKGCTNAQTIHSLIYIPKSKSAQKLRDLQKEFIERKNSGDVDLGRLQRQIKEEQDNVKRPSFALNTDSELNSAALVIIDEVSMVNSQMAEDLESFCTPILVLGDPAQLPPVKGGGHYTNAEPDVMLTEVHRQAQGSPVLHAATEVREGRGLGNLMTGMVANKGELSIEDLSKYDQILVGTNASRKFINEKMREHLGYTEQMPMVGERLICTRNDGQSGLLNGSQWIIRDVFYDGDEDFLGLTIEGDGQTITCDAHAYPFRGEDIPYFEMREKQCFEYAYAMTVHKSQGSQFDSVVLIDESHKFPAHQRRSWLYTGITRAAHDLKIVR